MALFYEQMLNNPNAQINIVHSSGFKLTTLIEQDFGFDTSAIYDSKDGYSSGAIQDMVNAAANATENGSQYVMKNIRETVSQWTGTNKPIFQIPATIFAYKPEIDTTKVVRDLLGLVGTQKAFDDEFGVLKAPGGYGVEKLTSNFGTQSLDGVWSISIGRYFRATGLTLLSFGHNSSAAVVASTNKPLYVRMSLTFQPAILPTADELQSWFL